MEAIERQWRDGENLVGSTKADFPGRNILIRTILTSQTYSMPTHPDPKCAALKRTDPAVPGD